MELDETYAVGILNPSYRSFPGLTPCGMVTIAGTEIRLGTCRVERPHFEVNAEKNRNFVLVRVLAFSCNYRDKALILRSALQFEQKNREFTQPIAWFGSDFVANVIAVGPDVTRLKAGDRVIPNCCFPYTPSNEVASGVTTNEASRGFLILHADKLSKIPDSMSNSLACGFSIGVQTARSMVRRLDDLYSKRVLVLSARSNTSRFVLDELRRLGVEADAASSSDWDEPEKHQLQPHNLCHVDRGKDWFKPLLAEKRYDVIVDPFFDLHIEGAVELLDYYGKYITCGLKNQHQRFTSTSDYATTLNQVMLKVMSKNLTVIGNCIGTFDDLEEGISDHTFYESGKPVDSIYQMDKVADFLERTYNSSSRYGKAILSFE